MKEKILSKIRHYIMELYHLITPKSLCDINEYNRLRKEQKKITLSSDDFRKMQFKTKGVFIVGIIIVASTVLSVVVYFPKYYQKTSATTSVVNDIEDVSNFDGDVER